MCVEVLACFYVSGLINEASLICFCFEELGIDTLIVFVPSTAVKEWACQDCDSCFRTEQGVWDELHLKPYWFVFFLFFFRGT